jgi:uncharacterized protein YjiS (DUF1127 family)
MSSLLIGCSALERHPPRAAGPSWWVRLARLITNEHRIRRTAREMRALDDRMLHDIGLDRGGIGCVARFGRA